MINHIEFLSATLPTGAIRGDVLIGTVQAWALLGVLLVVACGLLWFFSKPLPEAGHAPRPHFPRRARRGTHRPASRPPDNGRAAGRRRGVIAVESVGIIVDPADQTLGRLPAIPLK